MGDYIRANLHDLEFGWWILTKNIKGMSGKK